MNAAAEAPSQAEDVMARLLFCIICNIVFVGCTGTIQPMVDGGQTPSSCWQDVPALGSVDYWVATNGLDSQAGSELEPFASLDRARQAVRDNYSGQTMTVVIRGGEYPLTQTFQLGSQDSGNSGAEVTWKAYPGETVRITGSESLEPDWFVPLDANDPLFDRMPAAAQAQVQVVNLPDHGITDYGELLQRGFSNSALRSALELYVDGVPMELARWPNRGQTDQVDPTADAVVRGDIFGTGTTFTYLGTTATGNADDGYANYHGNVGGTDYYLYHCLNDQAFF